MYRKIHRIGAAAVFFISGGLFYSTMAPTVSFWDCGEFIACASTLGIPHPPGSPLYLLIGRIFTLLALSGDPAVPMNFLSVLTSAVSIMLVYLITARLFRLAILGEGTPGVVRSEAVAEIPTVAGATAASLMLAFSSTFWFNAVEAEVYGFSIMLMVLVLWLGLVWMAQPDRGQGLRILLFSSYLIGLAGGLHLLCLLTVPTLAVLVFHRRPEILRDRRVWLLVPLLFVLGYTTYVSLYLRSGLNPVIDENNPENLANFLMFLKREQYGTESMLLGVLNRRADFWGFQIGSTCVKYLLEQFPVPGLAVTVDFFRKATSGEVDPIKVSFLPYILGLAGAWVHFRYDRRRFLALLVLFLLTGVGLALYLNMPDPQPRERDYVFVGSFAVLGIWMGMAVACLVSRAIGKSVGFGIGLACLLALGMPAGLAIANYETHDRSENRFAHDYAHNILESCEPDAILFTNGDNDTFPLWYMQEALGIRKDVRVVCLSLLNTGWYIKQLRDVEPRLPIQFDDAHIDRDLTSFTRSAVMRSGRYWPEEREVKVAGISWTLPAPASRVLRVQDVMVLKIIDWVNWRRPIYFATTVPGENRLGLEDHLPVEGMVFRLSKEPGIELNPELLRRNLLEVYRYRGVTDPDIHRDAETLNLLINYYASFLQLAEYLVKAGRNEEAVSVLDRCVESALPPEDWHAIPLLVGGLHKAGAREKAQEILKRLKSVPGLPEQVQLGATGEVQMQLGRLDDAVTAYTEMFDKGLQPEMALYNRAVCRERMGDLEGALDDLTTLGRINPSDQEVVRAIEMIRRRVQLQGHQGNGGP